MSKSHDTPHETNLYTEYLLVDAFEMNDSSADFLLVNMLLIATFKTKFMARAPLETRIHYGLRAALL